MFSNSMKYILGGIATASVISIGLYLSLPNDYQEDARPVKAQNTDYERSIYGVPDLKLHPYRLNDDKYFDLVLDGTLNVGRSNPSALNGWYTRLVKNPSLATKHASLQNRIETAMKESESPDLIDSLESILAEEEAKQKAKQEQLDKLQEAKAQAEIDKQLEAAKNPSSSSTSTETDKGTEEDTINSTGTTGITDSIPSVNSNGTKATSDNDTSTTSNSDSTSTETTPKDSNSLKSTNEHDSETSKSKTTSTEKKTGVKGVSATIAEYENVTKKLTNNVDSIYDDIEKVSDVKALPKLYISMLKADYSMVNTMGESIKKDNLKNVNMYDFYKDGFNRFDNMVKDNKKSLTKKYGKDFVKTVENTSSALHALAKGYDTQSTGKNVDIKKLNSNYKKYEKKLNSYVGHE